MMDLIGESTMPSPAMATDMPHDPTDPHDLERFVDAQKDIYARALDELRRGRKQSHWSWFVIPQCRGLGTSPMAVRYGIGSLAEAAAYLAHPLLGPRLHETVEAMNGHRGLSAHRILGDVDARKFQSCLTLFAAVAGSSPVFDRALDTYFSGERDEATLGILARRRDGAS